MFFFQGVAETGGVGHWSGGAVRASGAQLFWVAFFGGWWGSREHAEATAARRRRGVVNRCSRQWWRARHCQTVRTRFWGDQADRLNYCLGADCRVSCARVHVGDRSHRAGSFPSRPPCDLRRGNCTAARPCPSVRLVKCRGRPALEIDCGAGDASWRCSDIARLLLRGRPSLLYLCISLVRCSPLRLLLARC